MKGVEPIRQVYMEEEEEESEMRIRKKKRRRIYEREDLNVLCK